LINKGSRTSQVSLRLAGAGAKAALERLLGPAPPARSGVSLGGQTFGHVTESGVLAGPARISTAERTEGRYVITVPASSAALLTIR
jgi:hypothetical protein